jgi:hypothetical protein
MSAGTTSEKARPIDYGGEFHIIRNYSFKPKTETFLAIWVPLAVVCSTHSCWTRSTQVDARVLNETKTDAARRPPGD